MLDPENCFHPSTFDLGDGEVQCIDCLKIWHIRAASFAYPVHPDCETCLQNGECICMSDFDHKEFEREMQPALDRIDDVILTQILAQP